MKNPDFIITGQKGGSTSLTWYLFDHPQIMAHTYPRGSQYFYETNFFCIDREFKKGIEHYRKSFPSVKGTLSGEASPDYMVYPFVPQLVKKYCPNVKLIFTMRNPVDRAYSQYCMHRNRGQLKPVISFEEALKRDFAYKNQNPNIYWKGRLEKKQFYLYTYVVRGLYYNILKLWLKYFPLEHICFIRAEDFFKNPDEEYNALLTWLGLKRHHLKNYYIKMKRTQWDIKFNEPLKTETRLELARIFKPQMEQFYTLVNRNFDWNLKEGK